MSENYVSKTFRIFSVFGYCQIVTKDPFGATTCHHSTYILGVKKYSARFAIYP